MRRSRGLSEKVMFGEAETAYCRAVGRRLSDLDYGLIDFSLDSRLRSCVGKGVLTVHSFGLVVDGCGVAIAGVSGSGKTTLGISACLAGAQYLWIFNAAMPKVAWRYFHRCL